MTIPNPDRYDKGAPAFVIMMLWGTASKFAQAIGKTPSTVDRWLLKGTIDGKYHPLIATAARRDGKPISPDMFVDKRVFEAAKKAPRKRRSAALVQ